MNRRGWGLVKEQSLLRGGSRRLSYSLLFTEEEGRGDGEGTGKEDMGCGGKRDLGRHRSALRESKGATEGG